MFISRLNFLRTSKLPRVLIKMASADKKMASADNSEVSDGELVAAAAQYDETVQEPWVLVEKKGDLFKCPETDSLAHCISEDCRMGKGIAVLFKNKFGGVQDLIKQGQKPGGLAVLKRKDRYVYYLVTKEKYFHKPTYSTLESSLIKMRDHCVKHNVTSVAMPQIGCGLDRLQWKRVKDMLHTVFDGTQVKITVYYL